jgi:hypothetical protein
LYVPYDFRIKDESFAKQLQPTGACNEGAEYFLYDIATCVTIDGVWVGNWVY